MSRIEWNQASSDVFVNLLTIVKCLPILRWSLIILLTDYPLACGHNGQFIVLQHLEKNEKKTNTYQAMGTKSSERVWDTFQCSAPSGIWFLCIFLHLRRMYLLSLLINSLSFPSLSLSLTLHPLGSIVYLGMMVGAFFWGGMADKVGRRQCLLICMSMNGFFAFLSSFVQSYGFFLLCRTIAGFGWVFCTPSLQLPTQLSLHTLVANEAAHIFPNMQEKTVFLWFTGMMCINDSGSVM